MRLSATLAAGGVAALLWGCSGLVPADRPLHGFPGAHELGATALVFGPDGTRLASGGLRGDIALWQVNPPRALARLRRHTGAVRALAYPAPQRLVSSGDDGQLLVWDLDAGAPLARAATNAVSGLAADHAKVFTAHRDGHLRAWRFPALEPIGAVRLDGAILALDRHGDTLAVATESGRVALFSTSLEWRRDLQAEGPAARDLRFGPDGKLLLAGTWFRLLAWNLETGAMQAVATEHHGLLTSVDVSADGSRIASLGRHTDSAVRIWDRASLTVERRYPSHELCGAMIRFSPDGRFLASASDDESVRLYDLVRDAAAAP
jgi:WD40 repeat protein